MQMHVLVELNPVAKAEILVELNPVAIVQKREKKTSSAKGETKNWGGGVIIIIVFIIFL